MLVQARSTMRADVLPLTALVLLLAAPVAAARRNLAQEPAAAAVDGQAAAAPPAEESRFGGPRIDACIELTNSAGQACTVESDTLSLVYPRGSEQLPTEDEVATAISNMKTAAQPSTSCCDGMGPYVKSRCPCDADYQQLLPVGGFDPAYFEGATAILAQACGLDFPPCQAGEVSQPEAALAAAGPGGR